MLGSDSEYWVSLASVEESTQGIFVPLWGRTADRFKAVEGLDQTLTRLGIHLREQR